MKKHILVAVESDTHGTANQKDVLRTKYRMKIRMKIGTKFPIPTGTHFFIFFLI